MNFQSHTVLITGGGSGIGLSLAEAFLQHGSRVVICGRDPQKLALAVQRFPALHALECDVSSETDVVRLKDKLLAQGIRPTLLINNAALQVHTDFLKTHPPEGFFALEQEVATNFTGLVKLTHLMLPILQEAPEAAIVNVTSGLAFVPKKTAPVYCATKAAVHAFSVALRYQIQDAGKPIQLLEAVLPLVDTPMTSGRGNARLKVSPESVAKRIIRGLSQNEHEVHVGGARLLLLLHRFVPALAQKIMRNGL